MEPVLRISLNPKTKPQFTGGFLLWMKAVTFPKACFHFFELWTKFGNCLSRTWLIKATWLWWLFFDLGLVFCFSFPPEPLEANEFLASRVIGICIQLFPAIAVLAAHRASSWSFFCY